MYNCNPNQKMESITCSQTRILTSLILLLSLHCLLSQADDTATAAVSSGLIQRTTKQQVLATIPPTTASEYAAPFLTSPSGKYTAYLLRHAGATPEDGGYGDDFCYIQIQGADSGASVWESECEPVSSSGACSLVFDEDAGLELLDGSDNPVWNSSADSGNSYPTTVELDEEGDMMVVDEAGVVVWSAGDVPKVNQSCWLQLGMPVLVPESPPFSEPVDGNVNPASGQQPPPQTPSQPTSGGLNQQQLPLPPPSQLSNGGSGQQPQSQLNNGIFGQQQPPSASDPPSQLSNGSSGQQQSPLQQPLQGLEGVNPASGLGAQPLVDNNRYDSGCTRNKVVLGVGFTVLSLLLFHGFGF